MSTSDVYITIYWCSLDHLYTWYCCRSQHAVMRCCARICIRSTHPTQGHVLYHTGTDYTAPTGQHELRGRSYRSGPLSSLKYLDHHMEIHCGTKLAGKISPPPCATYYIYIYVLRSRYGVFTIPFIIFALLSSLPPSRNSDSGSHINSRLFSLPPHYGSCLAIFIARRFQLFLPSSTRVELCTAVMGA